MIAFLASIRYTFFVNWLSSEIIGWLMRYQGICLMCFLSILWEMKYDIGDAGMLFNMCWILPMSNLNSRIVDMLFDNDSIIPPIFILFLMRLIVNISNGMRWYNYVVMLCWILCVVAVIPSPWLFSCIWFFHKGMI